MTGDLLNINRVKNLKFEDIQHYFDYPLTQTSEILGVSESFLKKFCRKLGINRWPYRQLSSLKQYKSLLLNKLAESNKNEQRLLLKIKRIDNSIKYLYQNSHLGMKEKSRIKKVEKNKKKTCQNYLVDNKLPLNLALNIENILLELNYNSDI